MDFSACIDPSGLDSPEEHVDLLVGPVQKVLDLGSGKAGLEAERVARLATVEVRTRCGNGFVKWHVVDRHPQERLSDRPDYARCPGRPESDDAAIVLT